MSGHTSGPRTVRPSRPEDAHSLIATLHDTFESPGGLRSPRRGDGVRDRGAATRPRRRGFVHWTGDFVRVLHVHSSAARIGVGAAHAAEAAIAAADHPPVRLETDTFNARSQAFSAARGYREAGRCPDEGWASGLSTLLLVKTFGADRASAP